MSGGDCGNQDYIMMMVRLTIVVVEVIMMMMTMRRRMMTRMMMIIRNLVIQVVVPTGVKLGKRLVNLKTYLRIHAIYS